MRYLALIVFFVLTIGCQSRAQIENLNTVNAYQTQNLNVQTISDNVNRIIVNQSVNLRTAKPFAPCDINLKIGVVENNQGEVCLTTRNYDLQEGAEIAVVFLNEPQTVQTANVQKKLPNSCSRNPEVNPDDSFYSLQFSQPVGETVYTAIGLINAGKIVITQDAASVDLNGDKKAEYFRVCTSLEGAHLTVWTGKPLSGKLIWHSYYYLGYDVEANCTKKDFEGMEN